MTEDKPRYSRLSDLLELIIFMQSEPLGVTINDIMERFKVSRRTAERMRDSLTCIFSQVDEIETDDKQKHWGFINYSVSTMISFTADEIKNIEQQQRRTTNKEAKNALKLAVEKMKALNNKNLENIDKEIELRLQTEGYAIRQMPQYKIEVETLATIRKSLQLSQKITGIYHDKKRELEPLGLIYGEKIYLIAREKAKGDGIYNYLLHKFRDLKLTDKTYDKGDFNLQEYTNQSFGVYHGEILKVKLSFDKELVADASCYNFHPSQKLKLEKDGTLTVTFNASGNKEIMWHVFKWGAGCKILAPQSLKEEYEKYLEDNLKNYHG